MPSEEEIPHINPESIPWHLGVQDAHCHPTDTMSTIQCIPEMKAAYLTVMATRFQDQVLVAQVADTHPEKVVPSFGYHPWFSHLLYDDKSSLQELEAEDLKRTHFRSALAPEPDDYFISLLPPPRPLSVVLEELRDRLQRFPKALVGEIGLDRGFRIPIPWSRPQTLVDVNNMEAPTPGGRENRRLSPHRVSMNHQKLVFTEQLKVAGELGRAVSVHGVQCHGALFDVFRGLWKGHEVVVESKKEKRRRRRRARDGAGHEYLPDQDDHQDSGEEEGSDAEQESWSPKPFPPRICLHSFSAPYQTLAQYLTPPTPTHRYPSQVFFSFSTTINARPHKGHLERIKETIGGVPDENILIESDLHTAAMIDEALAQAVGFVEVVKGWERSDCVRRLSENWRSFALGE